MFKQLFFSIFLNCKVGLTMGFNIAGATTTSVLVIIQPIVAELTNNVSVIMFDRYTTKLLE